VLAGEFQVVCPWLLKELVDLNLWDDRMKNMIIANNGMLLRFSSGIYLTVSQQAPFKMSLAFRMISRPSTKQSGKSLRRRSWNLLPIVALSFARARV
jgi:hypothetical protein